MITLHGSHRTSGLPQTSPFVSKAEVLLKMAGIPYTTAPPDFRKAPKGKIPFITIGDRVIGDTAFIRRYLETEHGVDFDQGLTASERATAHAFAALCDERLYWTIIHDRWLDDENFARGPIRFFDTIPKPMRGLVAAAIRRKIRRDLKGQGLGRHTPEEITALAAMDLDAISDYLADKPFLMGDQPTGADASVWSMATAILTPMFKSPVRDHAESLPNLVAYRDRGLDLWYPEFDRTRASRA